MEKPMVNIGVRLLCCSLFSLLAVSNSSAAEHTLLPSPQTVHIGYFSAALKPALTVESGDTVIIETATHIDPEEIDRSGCKYCRKQSRRSGDSSFPELPTIAEAGVPGYEAPIWFGVAAPAGTPRPIVDKLNAAINRAIQSDFFKARYEQIGDEPAGGTPEGFAALIKKESAKWADVVKRSGAKLE
jgi:hypothetical protein